MSQLTFRYARKGDGAAIVDLIERAYRGPEAAGKWTSEADLLTGPRTNHDEIVSLIDREDSRFILAEESGNLLGCCLVQGMSREPQQGSGYAESFGVPGYKGKAERGAINAAYFGMFAIDPQMHGAGLGKIVIAEAERRSADLWGANQMVMTVINLRSELITWYERRGYRQTGATLPFPFTETSGETHRNFHLVELRKDLA
jgi:GNAT superfamily N-acetyltransferase